MACFPLQNEGRKAHSAVLMASHIQGSGKTTLFEKSWVEYMANITA